MGRHSAPPSSLYRTASLGAPPGGPHTTLRADQLPTQPVYSAPRLSHNGRSVEPAGRDKYHLGWSRTRTTPWSMD